MHYFLRHSVCYLKDLEPKVSGKAIVRLSGRNGVGCWEELAQLAFYSPLIFTFLSCDCPDAQIDT